MFMKTTQVNLIGTIILIVTSLAFASVVLSSSTVGSIDTNNRITKICQDVSCSTFGSVNWKPTINIQTPGAFPVSISDTGITGHLWGNQIGWINLSPVGAGVTIDPSTGVLSGKAYA